MGGLKTNNKKKSQGGAQQLPTKHVGGLWSYDVWGFQVHQGREAALQYVPQVGGNGIDGEVMRRVDSLLVVTATFASYPGNPARPLSWRKGRAFRAPTVLPQAASARRHAVRVARSGPGAAKDVAHNQLKETDMNYTTTNNSHGESRNGNGNGYGNRARGASSKAAQLVAYAVEETDGETHWTRVGRMFPHSDGKGFVVLLSAMPLDKRIVIREAAGKPRAA